MEKHILSVSYDQPLLVTRQLILEQAGYDVSSAFGFAEAMEVCKDPARFRSDPDGPLDAAERQDGPPCGIAARVPSTIAVHIAPR